MRAITRVSTFLSPSLKAQVDALALPRVRTKPSLCTCGSSDWRECGGNARKASYVCRGCTRRRQATRVLASVTSAIDGTGVVDRMIAEHLKHPTVLPLHIPTDRPVMVGLYMSNAHHDKATALADKRPCSKCTKGRIFGAECPHCKGTGTKSISLSALLASIIAAKVQPVEKAA